MFPLEVVIPDGSLFQDTATKIDPDPNAVVLGTAIAIDPDPDIVTLGTAIVIDADPDIVTLGVVGKLVDDAIDIIIAVSTLVDMVVENVQPHVPDLSALVGPAFSAKNAKALARSKKKRDKEAAKRYATWTPGHRGLLLRPDIPEGTHYLKEVSQADLATKAEDGTNGVIVMERQKCAGLPQIAPLHGYCGGHKVHNALHAGAVCIDKWLTDKIGSSAEDSELSGGSVRP